MPALDMSTTSSSSSHNKCPDTLADAMDMADVGELGKLEKKHILY
jgi:hypothetical protein